MSRIVLFGATGYTGGLVAESLVAAGARPVLAGRDPARLEQRAAELGSGLETAVADVARPATLRALVERDDVLISTVGPFARWGDPAAEAAIDAGAAYVDSTGEPAFICRVFEELGPRATASGALLHTAFGYDFVPGNLAAALALREAGEGARRAAVGYFGLGMSSDSMSGGTKASLAGAMVEPGFAFRGGRVVTERGAKRVRDFTVRGKDYRGISVGASEHYALPRAFPQLTDVEAYLGWFGPAARAAQAFSAASSVAFAVPGTRSLARGALGRLVRGSTGGPGPEVRARGRSHVVGVAEDAGGTPLAEVHLEGVEGYTFTAGIIAWAARRLAAGTVQGAGAMGPVDAFGLDSLEEGAREAGLERA